MGLIMLEGIWENRPTEHDDCPRCSLRLTPGVALIGAPRGLTYEGAWPVRLQDCLKCEQCGYSERVANGHTYLKAVGKDAAATWNPHGTAFKRP
jgi:hypothetical protein